MKKAQEGIYRNITVLLVLTVFFTTAYISGVSASRHDSLSDMHSIAPFHNEIDNSLISNDGAPFLFPLNPLGGRHSSWLISLNLTTIEAEQLFDIVYFGEDANASDGVDSYDVPKPGAPPDPYIYAWFDANLSGPYVRLWKDIRFYPSTAKVWDLYVLLDNTQAMNISISWNPANVSASEYSDVDLKDINGNILADMLLCSTYTYLAQPMTVRHFQINCSVAPAEYQYLVMMNFSTMGPEQLFDIAYFGENTNASDGVDSYDVPKPGAPPDPYIYAWFDANLSGPYVRLWKDIRFYPDTAKVWDLYVLLDTTEAMNISISWNPGNVSASEYSNVDLKNINGNILADMLLCSTYTYLAQPMTVRHFQINCGMEPTKYLYMIPLSEEWNFVSFLVNESVAKSDINVRYLGVNYSWQDAVTGGIIVNLIYGWSPSLKNYYVSDVFDPGAGYWVYAYEACHLSITTDAINDDTYISSLLQEWNLVGLPFSTPVNKLDLVVVHNGSKYSWQDAVSGGIIMNSVYGWSPSVKNYVMSDVFDPGTAYWMYAYQNCILKKGG